MDFGPAASEYDDHLLDYFVESAQISGLVATSHGEAPPSDFVLIARRGGGKTALKRWLSTANHKFYVFTIDPETSRVELVGDQSNLEDTRILIRFEVLYALLANVLRELEGVGWLHGELDEVKHAAKGSPVEQFLKNVQDVKAFGFGFRLNSADRVSLLRLIRDKQLIPKLEESLKRAASELQLVLVVDNPEMLVIQGVDPTPADPQMRENAQRVGAVLSAMQSVHSKGVRTIVLIRDEIARQVREVYQDYQQIEDSVGYLAWTDDDLIQIIEARLSERMKKEWSAVFKITPKSFRDKVLCHLVNGPRDLIQLCNLSLTAEQEITNQSLSEGYKALRERREQEIGRSFKNQYPDLEMVVRAVGKLVRTRLAKKSMRAIGGSPLWNPSEFQEMLVESFSDDKSKMMELRERHSWLDRLQWEERQIAVLLYHAGALGFKRGSDISYAWSGAPIDDFLRADKWFLSPLFLGK